MDATVLFVDDEPHVLEGLRRAMRGEPYRVLVAGSGRHALEILGREEVDVLVTDEEMDGMRGSELVARVRLRHPDTVRILLTGRASLPGVLRAVNEGEIYRFLTKPCNVEELKAALRQAVVHRRLLVEGRRLLAMVRRQRALLERLEREHPGITALETDPDGALVIDLAEMPADELVREMRRESERATAQPATP
ncbi:MAG: response regulator [Acidobacteria bacterium]|nr:MAG: response regulator [Acidobacteriota bacterium]